MTATPLILGHSWLDDAILSASSEALPVANLKSTDVRKPWRSTGPGTPFIEADFGGTKTCGYLFLGGINLTTAATISVVLSNHPDFSAPVFVTTFAPSPHGLEPPFAADRLDDTGGHLVVDGNGDTIVDSGGDTLVSATWSLPVSARYLRLSIDDPANSDGYLEIGRVKIGDPFTTTDGHDWGASVETVDTSTLARTRGGALFAAAGPTFRAVQLSWSWLTDAEMAALEALRHEVGKRGDVVLSVYPDDDTLRGALYTVLGRMSDWTASSRQATRLHTTGIRVEGAV